MKGKIMSHLFLSMILIFVTCAWSQITLSGKVTCQSGAAIPGVAVLLEGKGVSVNTDGQGNYQFGSTMVSFGQSLLATSRLAFSGNGSLRFSLDKGQPVECEVY